MRFNIDPKGDLTDSEIIEMLKKASLEDILNRGKEKAAEGGK